MTSSLEAKCLAVPSLTLYTVQYFCSYFVSLYLQLLEEHYIVPNRYQITVENIIAGIPSNGSVHKIALVI